MNRSNDRILTTHTGRLNEGRDREEKARDLDYVRTAMRETVKKQLEIGFDSISDGEFGKFGGINYYGPRLTGLTIRPLKPGETAGMGQNSHERKEFAQFYADQATSGTGLDRARAASTNPTRMICNGPITYQGQEQVQHDIDMFREALQGLTVGEAFMCVLAPGWIEHSLFNEYYKTNEEFLFALAEAMREEYEAIVNAGFILQIDDPGLPDTYDMLVPLPSIEDYRKFEEVRVEALNHALRNIPEEKIRYHICWGSWHGPHTHDLELKYVVDLMLRVKAQAYSVEAANPRHEHEWKVWRETKLPEGKILIPGVVSHASNVVEHPELVAERLSRFAALVGRENVIGGTDCGMGGRVHMQVGWAKLKALVEGAELASRELWG